MRLVSQYHGHRLLSVFARFLVDLCKLCNKINPIPDGWVPEGRGDLGMETQGTQKCAYLSTLDQ